MRVDLVYAVHCKVLDSIVFRCSHIMVVVLMLLTLLVVVVMVLVLMIPKAQDVDK